MMLCARTQNAAFYSGHSGQSPLVLNHIEPHYKDKVGSIPRSRLVGSDLRAWHRSRTDYAPTGRNRITSCLPTMQALTRGSVVITFIVIHRQPNSIWGYIQRM